MSITPGTFAAITAIEDEIQSARELQRQWLMEERDEQLPKLHVVWLKGDGETLQ